MRKTRIFFPDKLSINTTAALNKAASHHLIRVLRMKTGAEITVFNNSGHEFECTLLNEHQSAASIRVNHCHPCQTESSLRIHLLQGISRGDRMDLSIQKATELGVHKITPVMCERSNVSLSAARTVKKLEHWQQIIISASEQSGRCQLAELTAINNLVAATAGALPDVKLVLDPTASTTLRTLNRTQSAALLSGPEGGLSNAEISQATSCGFIAVSLGPRILRTETAGIACVAALQSLWGDLA